MSSENKVTFGRHLRSDFFLEDKYIPLNHGSFGVYPRSIHKVLREYQDKTEEHPDRWNRIEVNPLLRKSRELIAELINCPDASDVAFVQNASTGVATILRSFPFEKGDKVICFESTYVNVNATLKYLQDIGQVELISLNLKYPLTDGEVLDILRATIQEHNKERKIRLAVLDAIIAQPGTVFPYEAASRLVQENGILSLIDAAHSIGQIPIDISLFDPDFFVSNLHKWFFTPRGSCILYAPKRNQRYLHPLTINYQYSPEGTEFEQEFWNFGAYDHSPFLCIAAAIEYRKSLGGEEAIRDYIHNLAVEGGNVVAKHLGTQVMENQDKTLIGAMVNVEIPLYPKTLTDAQVSSQFIHKIIYEQNCMAPAFKHNNKWWVRLSAQIYNDLKDFENGAKAIEKVCQELSI